MYPNIYYNKVFQAELRYRSHDMRRKLKDIDVLYSDTDLLFIKKSIVGYDEFVEFWNTEVGRYNR